jgi:hypothetical protein
MHPVASERKDVVPSEIDRLLAIVQAVSISGPPFRYNEGDDPEDGRKKGTYDCTFCGPQSFTLSQAYDPSHHNESCPWRMAREEMNRRQGRSEKR